MKVIEENTIEHLRKNKEMLQTEFTKKTRKENDFLILAEKL